MNNSLSFDSSDFGFFHFGFSLSAFRLFAFWLFGFSHSGFWLFALWLLAFRTLAFGFSHSGFWLFAFWLFAFGFSAFGFSHFSISAFRARHFGIREAGICLFGSWLLVFLKAAFRLFRSSYIRNAEMPAFRLKFRFQQPRCHGPRGVGGHLGGIGVVWLVSKRRSLLICWI